MCQSWEHWIEEKRMQMKIGFDVNLRKRYEKETNSAYQSILIFFYPGFPPPPDDVRAYTTEQSSQFNPITEQNLSLVIGFFRCQTPHIELRS